MQQERFIFVNALEDIGRYFMFCFVFIFTGHGLLRFSIFLQLSGIKEYGRTIVNDI